MIRPQSEAAFKSGTQDIRVKFTPKGGETSTETLKVNVIDEADLSWADSIEGLDKRAAVDFTSGTSQDVPKVTVPVDAAVSVKGLNQWSVKNENGTLRVTAPSNFTGENPVDKDLPITIKKDGSTIERTLKLTATPPKPKPVSYTHLTLPTNREV